jgi:predicted metal-dependent HD superfamily phosphohydrolase
MARALLFWHHYAPAHLIEVAVTWQRGHGALAPTTGYTQAAQGTATSAELLATYRRHRQRLADAVRPQPTEKGRPGKGDEATAPTEPSVADLFAPDLLEAATALYDPTLPYHNAGHALRAVSWGERLLRVCAQAGVRVDATVVRLALLFHDAGYGTDPSTIGCPDAETYACTLARRALTGRISTSVLHDVEAAILDTRRTNQPVTPEGMVVRAADLADLAAGYDTFAANSEALRVEQERLSGARLSLAEWRDAVDRLLSDYLEERLWPLELLHDGSEQPGFHAAAKANLRRYLVRH